jgi:putative polymerase
MSWIVFTWLIRQRIDLKSVRDLMIPILFLSLGRFVADSWFADRCMRKIAFLVLTVALLETIFVAAYGDLFNPFAFYAGLGSIRESAAMFEGQTLTLNGFRPESIGRTLLPAVFGSHRTSSVFLEPVSLGNFAVILLAWALSNARSQFGRNEALMCGVAMVLIALSDSRFGMLMAILLPVYRLLPVTVFRWVAPTFPFVIFASILGVALVLPVVGDNLLGRIAVSGQAFLRFDEATLLGLHSPLPGFGDMGYAYVVSRFGVVTVIALIIVLFLIPVASERASRFRGLIVLYLFSNLAISGTSVFALKTAGLMWFLFGAVAADPRQAFRRVMRSSV